MRTLLLSDLTVLLADFVTWWMRAPFWLQVVSACFVAALVLKLLKGERPKGGDK